MIQPNGTYAEPPSTPMQLRRTLMSPGWSPFFTRYRRFFDAQADRDSDSPFRYEGDVEEFLRQSAQIHKGKVNIIHSSFDPVDIHVRENRAISEAFCLVTSSVTLSGTDYELASHMRLFTRLEKLSEPSEWRLLSLESSYVRDRLVTAYPSADASLPPIMTREAQAYPKCYRNLALVMLSRGLEPRPNLPHEDSPDSVWQISDRNRAFLDSAKAEFI